MGIHVLTRVDSEHSQTVIAMVNHKLCNFLDLREDLENMKLCILFLYKIIHIELYDTVIINVYHISHPVQEHYRPLFITHSFRNVCNYLWYLVLNIWKFDIFLEFNYILSLGVST